MTQPLRENTVNDSITGVRHGAAPLPLSILDFAMAGKGLTAREALAASIDLSRLVDRRGFTRYWVAEHPRSEERRRGIECVSTVRSRWSQDQLKKNTHKIQITKTTRR